MTKYITLMIAMLSVTWFSYGQRNITLSVPDNVSKDYIARDYVKFLPGYSFKAASRKTLHAAINEGIVPTPEYQPQSELLGSTTIRPLNTSYLVGSTVGSAGASPSGAAVYTIPIEVPAGINGMQPNVSVLYNSQSHNGLVGYAWNLSAFSVISRTGKTYYHDGNTSAPDLSNNDNLMLDGQRLILTNGSNLTANAQYRTEIETFSKITYTTINGKLCFEIQTKDGQILQYGATNDSYIEAQNSNVATFWLLSKVTDTNGNYMTYHYQKNKATGEFFLQRIEYAGNTSAGISPACQIEFLYASRNDVQKTYHAGSLITSGVILEKIKTVSAGVNIKEYQFKYYYDGLYSKLTEVVESGMNGSRYNATNIVWGSGSTSSLENAITVETPPTSTTWRPLYADFDGDGKTDFLYYQVKDIISHYTSVDIATLYLSWSVYGSYPFKKTTVTIPLGKYFAGFLTGDFNGDGLADIVRINYSSLSGKYEYIFFLFDGTSFTASGAFTSDSAIAYVGDFDGDGKDDILTKSESKIYRQGQTSIATSGLSWATLLTPVYSNGRFLIDFNGNGKTNLLMIFSDSYKVYELNGSVFSEIFSGTDMKNVYEMIELLGDFNGDGKTDILVRNVKPQGGIEYFLLISKGDGFERKNLPDLGISGAWFTGDFNGDGKTDIISCNQTHYYVFPMKVGISTGDSFQFTNYNSSSISSSNMTMPFTYLYLHFADFDGDGRTDMCFDYKPDRFVMKSFQRGQPLLVERIIDGLNRDILFEYSFLYDNTQLYRETNSIPSVFPVVKSAPLKVVKSIVTGEGQINNASYARTGISYSYKDLRVHKQGKGFLCFGEIQTNESYYAGSGTSESYITVSKYNYSSSYYYPYIKEEKKSAGGISVSTTTNVFQQSLLGGKRIFPYLSSQTIKDEQTGLTASVEISGYDSYGNPKTIKTTKGNLTETTTVTYQQKGSWCPNKQGSVSVTKTLNGVSQTRATSYEYDSNGNLTKKTTDPSDVNKTVTEYKDYDLLGHPLTVTLTANNQSRTSSVSYTPSKRFLQKEINELGETFTYNWNESRGTLSSKTDRIGTTSYFYDDMNRLTNTFYPDGMQEFNYLQWATGANSRKLYYSHSQVSGASPLYTWYNSFGQEVLRETYGLNNRKISVFSDYEAYRKRISAPTFGSSASSWDAVYEYDKLGRVSKLTTLRGETNYTYNGKKTTVVSPTETRETILNTEGWVETSKVNGKSVAFSYYPSGLVKNSTPEGKQAIITEYDLQGNRTRLIDPDAGVIRSKYNGFGDLLWTKQKVHLTGDSILTEYNYRSDGLLQQMLRNGEVTSYTYDNQNRLSSVGIAGQHKQTFTYNSLDRITNVKDEIGTRIYNTGITYDSYGRVKRETFPSGYYTENMYDSYGNLVEVVDKSGRSLWKAVDENARGQVTRLTKGSRTTTYGYDSYGFPASISCPGIVNLALRFDEKGNLDMRKNLLNGQEERFGYKSNQLDSWKVYQNNVLKQSNTISYNAITGNIDSKSDVGYTQMLYGEGNNKPHALTSHAVSAGGVLPTDNLIVTYTDFKKIKTLTEGDKSYMVTYGVDDQRCSSVYKKNNVVKETRYYLGDYEEEINSAGNVRKIHYLRGGGIFIQNNGVDSLLYTYIDHLGSLIVLTDQSGNIVENYAYDPWGVRRNPTDWTQRDNRTWKINRGFTGHEHIDQFGIINMNGRVYDPLSARFFSPDPYVQSPGDWFNYDRYSYCLNNPLLYTDPTGEKWKWYDWLGLELLTAGLFSSTITATTAAAMMAVTTVASSMPATEVAAAWVRGLYDPIGAGSQLNNGQRIDLGLFQTDPNKNFGKRLLQVTSRFTWELPQTLTGYSYSHVRNLAGQVDRVDYLGGATFVTNENSSKHDGITLGNYVNMNIKEKITGSFKDWVLNDPMYMHEYGHTIDSRNWGPAYLFGIGIPSLISASNSTQVEGEKSGVSTHDFYWTEMRANKYAKRYFGKYYGINWNTSYHIWGSEYFYLNTTIETFYPTTKR